MDKRPHSNLKWLVLAAVLTAAASLFALYRYYENEAEARRSVIVERGDTVLEALAAGIRAHGRMGRFRADRLSLIFDELANTPDVVGLELKTVGGVSIASGGDLSDMPEVALLEPLWQGDRVFMATETRFFEHDRSGPGPGRGPGHGGPGGRRWQKMLDIGDPDPWIALPLGPYVITAALDTTDVYGLIRRDQARLAVSAAVVVAAITLATVAAFLFMKRRSLEEELLLARERAGHSERLAQLGAGLAHETKNPLGIVRGLAQSIGDSADACPDVKRFAHDIIDEVDRTVGQVNSFLSLAKPKDPVLAPVDVDEFFERLLPLVQSDAKAAGALVIYESSGLRVEADEELLRRAVLNVILNALRASAEDARVTIKAAHADGAVSLAVSDNGCGISPEDLPRVTEAYFTRFEGGCGLGLAIVDQIAQAHGWALRIESTHGKDTRVSFDGMREVE